MKIPKFEKVHIKSAVAAVSAVAIVGWAWGGGGAAAREAEPEVNSRQLVVTAPVATVEGQPVRFPGITRARQRADLAFIVPGRLQRRLVALGETVKKGQALAQLDTAGPINQVRANRGSLAAIEKELEQLTRDQARSERLVDRGAAGTEELEKVASARRTLEARRNQLLAQLDEADRQRRETVLYAPFAGTVTDVHLQAGEFAQPGRPVISISGAGSLEVEVRVPETWRDRLAPGDTASVMLPLSQSAPVVGNLRTVGNAGGGRGHLFAVLVDLEPVDGLVAGLAAEVELTPRGEAQTTVPVSAVTSPAGVDSYVFRVREGRAERVPVEVIQLVGRRVYVNADLADDDRVVVAGHATLLDGDLVRSRTN